MSTEDHAFDPSRHLEDNRILVQGLLAKIQKLEKENLLLQEAVALLSEEAADKGLGLPSNRVDLHEVEEEALRKFIPDSWLLK